MRSLFVAFLIMVVAVANGYSECSYFRVSTALLKCAVVDTRTLHSESAYQAPSEVPELQEVNDQALVQVKCDCEYSLMGSDPRCDTDQSLEKSTVTGADIPAQFCRRGRSLCRDVCPPRLP